MKWFTVTHTQRWHAFRKAPGEGLYKKTPDPFFSLGFAGTGAAAIMSGVNSNKKEYLQQLRRALADIEAKELPPSSPEEALERFFRLMEDVLPFISAFPRPWAPEEEEPEELGFYRYWRQRESARSNT